MALIERVYLSEGERSTQDEAMFVLARLPYLALVKLAAAISADADKIADAIEAWEAVQADLAEDEQED